MAEKFSASLKKLVLHPKQFFNGVEKDKDYSKIMFFYVKMAVIAAIFSLVCSLIILSARNKLTATSAFNGIVGGIVNIGLAFLIPFVISFIVHLGVLIFRGKQGYFNTYKAITYPLAITLVYGILSTIIVSIIGLTNPMTLTPEQLTTNPELLFQETGYIASIIVALIILFISLIHALCVQVIGVARFQKMSKLRAFFSIIIIPVIILIVALVLMFYYINQLIADYA